MAPQPVILSDQIVADYGHICASVGHPAAYGLFRRAAGPSRQPQRVPNLLYQSIHPMPPPVLRWSQRLLATMPSSLVLPSPLSHWLGNHKSHHSGPGGACNEAAAFALCYGLDMLLAPLRPGLLLPSLHGQGHPRRPRRLSLDGSSSFTIAGLPPAGLAALWAANETLETTRILAQRREVWGVRGSAV